MSPAHEDLMQQHLRNESLPEAVMPACPTNKPRKGQKAVVTGGSAFNIKAESLRLGNFCQEEIATLWSEKIYQRDERGPRGHVIQVWGM